MSPENNGRTILGETNYAWLKEYMAPLRERIERDRAVNDVEAKLLELRTENRRLKQTVSNLTYNQRPAVRFFRRSLPQLLGLPSR